VDTKEAVAAKLEAQTEQSIAEAERTRVETRKVSAEADAADAMAKIARIELGRRERLEEEEKAQDECYHVFRFRGEINFSAVGECIAKLAEWSRTAPGCAIELVITSGGGEVVAGMALFDYIQQLRAKGHIVTTSASGIVASLAVVLLQAGDWRTMGKESYLLIHEAGAEAGGKIGEIEDIVTFVKKTQNRTLDIYASRSKVPREYFAQHWRRKDWFLDSDECLRLGLVDEVQSHPFPGAKTIRRRRVKEEENVT